MLNPVLSNLSLTIEQVKNIEKELSKNITLNEKNMLVLLVENSGQVIATNGKNTRNYDLSSIAALSVASFESTRGLAKVMGQTFKYLFNQGTTSNLFITRANDQTLLVIDYDPLIKIEEVHSVVDNFSNEINKMAKDWSVIGKNDMKPGQGPLKNDGLDDQIDNMFGHLG
ncbi:MAG: roadblock/LC7 domain-containing protein [Candidatus Sericytochromatia bacterium]|nr:roadblock/LC7 domain-containing protein [Candidatus Sericytochromatia bacterium]